MHYVIAKQWSLLERFEITDESGTPQLEARGHFRSRISLHDGTGAEVAEIRKHLLTDTHEIYLGGEEVAKVKHSGFFGDHYDIDTPYGRFRAKGHFDGGDYRLEQDGSTVAHLRRKFSLREKFAIETAHGQNDLLILAIMLAIEAIHEERREQDRERA